MCIAAPHTQSPEVVPSQTLGKTPTTSTFVSPCPNRPHTFNSDLCPQIVCPLQWPRHSLQNAPHFSRRTYHSGDPFHWEVIPRDEVKDPEDVTRPQNPSDSITRYSQGLGARKAFKDDSYQRCSVPHGTKRLTGNKIFPNSEGIWDQTQRETIGHI
jgi:hypothetical protein